MKLTVMTLVGQTLTLNISEEIELENFIVLCELELDSRVLSKEITIIHNGRPLTEFKRSLKALGLRDGDIVSVLERRCQGQYPKSEIMDSNRLIESRGSGRSQTSLHSSVVPPVHANAASPLQPHVNFGTVQISVETFASSPRVQPSTVPRSLNKNAELKCRREDLEEQRRIAEEIRKENINANFNAALEHSPEIFGSVVMLYINCKVNGHPVKAFVDSGAQITVMSLKCAERCNILRLVDTRFEGMAVGVGRQKILGRVHVAQIQIENDFLISSFDVMKDQPMDIILGLDMLRRHQCLIDLKNGVLQIGTTCTKTPFLSEAHLSAAELEA